MTALKTIMALSLALGFSSYSFSEEAPQAKKSETKKAESSKKPSTKEKSKTMVKVETSMGDFTLALDAEKAPETVKNFLAYVDKKFYDGTIFHRVISDFMIQGGGFTEDMNQKKTESAVKNEADNGLKNDLGTVAMARTSDPHSATAQFFINVKDNSFLNHRSKTTSGWGYAVFGKVTDGMDTIEKIKMVSTTSKNGMKDVPEKAVIIKKVTRL